MAAPTWIWLGFWCGQDVVNPGACGFRATGPGQFPHRRVEAVLLEVGPQMLVDVLMPVLVACALGIAARIS
jgi:hypothetical protein